MRQKKLCSVSCIIETSGMTDIIAIEILNAVETIFSNLGQEVNQKLMKFFPSKSFT